MGVREQVEAAVEARYREPVDGGGLPLAEHVAVVVDPISADNAAMLCHELGNVLFPMRSALNRLADDLDAHHDIHAEEMVVRLAIGLRRLSALDEALRARAGEG